MARYTDESRERLRDAVDFTELVGARTELRPAGPRRSVGLCPFHDERTPSFGIDPIEKLYHCFGCGAGGDVFQFVMDTEAVDFTGALELLADRYGIRLEPVSEDPQEAHKRQRRTRLLDLLERTASFYQRMLWESGEAESAREYLKQRGLNEEVLREFRVGYAPSAWDKILVGSQRGGFSSDELIAVGLVVRGQSGGVYDRFRGRVIFPLSNNRGAIIGFGARALRDNQQPKYVNSPDGELFHKGRWLYGSASARVASANAGEVVVVEGYTDVLALHQAGIKNSVAMMGTAFTDQQALELTRLAPSAVFCLDADSAGQEAVARAATILSKQRRELRAVALPSGSDPAQLVFDEGPDAMSKLIADAVPFARFQVERVLQQGDLASSTGRDRVLAQLGGIIQPLAPSVLRQQLIQHVAGRLGLGENLLLETLHSSPRQRDALGSSPRVSYGRQRDQNGRGGPQIAFNRRIQTEMSFLALCIGLPDEGDRYLEQADLEALFESPEARRVAAYLKGRLRSPGADLSQLDPNLSKVVAELVIRAGKDEVTPRAIELESLQLELGRLEREIAKAKIDGGPAAHDLVKERSKIQANIGKLLL